MRRIHIMILAAALVTGTATMAGAQDWGQWRNQNRNQNQGWGQNQGYGNHQWRQDQDRDRDGDRNRRAGGYNNGGNYYQQGFNQGVADARNGGRRSGSPNFGNRDDRRAWEQGYNAGYSEGRRGYRNGGGYGNGGYGNGGYGYPNGGYGNGYPSGGYGYPNGGYGNGRGYGNGGYGQAQQVGYQDGLTQGRGDRNTGHSYRPTEHAAYRDADHQHSVIGGDSNQYKQAYRQGYMQGYQQGYNGR